ncbi:MAG: hypothetical protein R3281_06755, partial [Balneolaceae bacterium]|nr:hypothetical protein [Balneolaceae bacterium]
MRHLFTKRSRLPVGIVCFAIVLTIQFQLQAQPNETGLGIFENHTGVGEQRLPGTAQYDPEQQRYTLEGLGNIAGDQFHYLYRELEGDFILRARAQFSGETSTEGTLGWMIRSELAPSSSRAFTAVSADGTTTLQYRTSSGKTEKVELPVAGPNVIQLERNGNTVTVSVARFGEEFTTAQINNIALPSKVYAGLFANSDNPEVARKARFRNVRIVKPAPETLVPYEDYLGSNLEILEVETGHRNIIYQIDESLQAPNWTPEGNKLIYNHNGLLYHFNLETNRPEILDTDFAINNNNDHVLTFDGTILGISDHTEHPDGESLIYRMPADGGIPQRVTEHGPSYLHGWSPDNRFMVYTARRDGEYDIYKIPAKGGEEIRLTTAPGLDDGPEYTPDGQYIYFNSTRSGSMEIWRMKPDGSGQEQLTNDRLNNWFPHISPDGKQVVFISYPETVDPSDHPFYKRVYLRLMPL